MPLSSLEIFDFRVYQHVSLSLNPHLNLIVGNNASGKTSLLEAIYFLSTGKSFRSAAAASVLRDGAEKSVVTARIFGADEQMHVGMAITKHEKKVSLGGIETAKVSDIARLLPVLVISPDSHFSFMGAAKHRRSTLDWILFHVEPGFGEIFSRYNRALHQRNSTLRNGTSGKLLDSWDIEVASLGEIIHQKRNIALSEIRRHYEAMIKNLVGIDDVSLEVISGWNKEKKLVDCYRDDKERDMSRGFTHSGPHRNDLHILLGGKKSQDIASHGQNKLLISALRLAQIACFKEMTGKKCSLLIDDLSAELDAEHRKKILNILRKIDVQVFITATDLGQLDFDEWESHSVFHVEHGMIKKLEKSYKSATNTGSKVVNFPV